MKTIVRKNTNVSLYLLPNSTVVIVGPEQTQVGADPVEFFVGDCNVDDALLYENVVAPEDWAPLKYLFDGTEWTLNPDWTAPELTKE